MTAIIPQEKRFTCQQSGHCCSSREIVVTVTYRDLFRLYTALESNFQQLLNKISFFRLDKTIPLITRKQMVLTPIKTGQGNVIPGLRKREDNSCILYYPPNCGIYNSRPLACRNYPLAFIKKKKEITCVWVKNSLKSCPGIGKGPPLDFNTLKNNGIEHFKEIQTHNHIVADLNVESVHGKPLTARESLWVLLAYGEKENQELTDT